MTSALACHATNSNLAEGNYASCQGFKVTSDDAGSGVIDRGSSLSCHGGPTGKVSLFQFLHQADSTAGNRNFWLSYRLSNLFDSVNGCGIY